ncbi:MAG: hypothetical protein WAT66_12000 [Actinomycetota bacterium]
MQPIEEQYETGMGDAPVDRVSWVIFLLAGVGTLIGGLAKWTDNDVLWGALLVFLLVAGIATVGWLANLYYRGWRYSRLSRTRTFAKDPAVVQRAVLAAIENSRFAVYERTDETITVAPRHLGGNYAGPGAPPVAHVVMLPTEEGGTRLEVIGGKGPSHYAWHMMAQEILKELDKELSPVIR